MARIRKNTLPKYVELNPHDQTYYYRHPGMVKKACLGRSEKEAVRLANALNARYRIHCEPDSKPRWTSEP